MSEICRHLNVKHVDDPVTVSQEMRAREYTMSAHEINALLYTCQAAGRWSLQMPLSLFKLSGDISSCSADFHMCGRGFLGPYLLLLGRP